MSWLSDLFGGSSKKTQSLIDNLPKQKAYSQMDFPGFEQDYLAKIKNQMSGRDIGYDPGVLSAANSAWATTQRAGLNQNTIPMINARASAAGLGKSSIIPQQIGQVSSNVENAIGEQASQLQLANEQQKKTDINNAMTRYVDVTKDYEGAKNMQSQLDYANYLTQIGLSQQADQIKTGMLQKIAQTVGGGVVALGGFATSNPVIGLSGLSMMGGNYNLSGGTTSELSELLNKLDGNNASLVQLTKGVSMGGGGNYQFGVKG